LETLAYFEQLGTLVDQRWAVRGRSPQSLAEVATEALLEVPVPDAITPGSILDRLVDGADLPKQRPASDQFGQPPVVMYRAGDLEVQALVWMDGTTSIHQHGFDGAFRVFSGSSLHVPYGFTAGEVLADDHLVVGDLSMGDPEILWPGDVRPIVSGGGFIHALFHLEHPSVTIVVRNTSSDLPFPQYSYRLPGLGFDELHSDDRMLMRLRGLRALHQIDPTRAGESALEVVRSQDLWQSFRLCDYWAQTVGDGPELAALIEVLSARAGPLSEIIGPVYAEDQRRWRLLARRSMLRESHHRMFLALIVNLPDRASIHSAVAQLFPDMDPDQVVMDWVQELSGPEFRGVSGLRMGADDLALLRTQLSDGQTDDALDVVASRWKPPMMIEKLFA
jgi:hypothetical protein